MKLFPDWQGIINIPPSPPRKEVVGKNVLLQQAFRGAHIETKADATDSNGYYLISSQLAYPFNEILLRLKGARRIKTDSLVLCAPEMQSIYNLGSDTRLEWDDIGLLNNRLCQPRHILENWKGKFSFREESEKEGVAGLRPPQIGALHALAAHFSVGSEFEPATVVLPTGTGKTETMISFHMYKVFLSIKKCSEIQCKSVAVNSLFNSA